MLVIQSDSLDYTEQDVVSQLPLPIENSDWEFVVKNTKDIGTFTKKLISLTKMIMRRSYYNEHSF